MLLIGFTGCIRSIYHYLGENASSLSIIKQIILLCVCQTIHLNKPGLRLYTVTLLFVHIYMFTFDVHVFFSKISQCYSMTVYCESISNHAVT